MYLGRSFLDIFSNERDVKYMWWSEICEDKIHDNKVEVLFENMLSISELQDDNCVVNVINGTNTEK